MKMDLREALHVGELHACHKGISTTASSAKRCGARFRKFIQRWRSAVSLSIGKNIGWDGCSQKCALSLRNRGWKAKNSPNHKVKNVRALGPLWQGQ